MRRLKPARELRRGEFRPTFKGERLRQPILRPLPRELKERWVERKKAQSDRIERMLSSLASMVDPNFKPSYFAEYFPAQVPSHKDVPSKSELHLDGEKTKTTSTDDATKTN
ncbi:hypothetical protein AALP_AA8G009100 [Arabis alpina]|uniref:Uncharacterized protein n=1 Tax=Arabis alpina TaxID=50452 RepID=A0A087G463_ARAAL|nr:hypothetical protein AALP_AA8G009100 [Arabis alpina]